MAGGRLATLRKLLEEQGISPEAQDFDEEIDGAALPGAKKEPRISMTIGEPVINSRVPMDEPELPPEEEFSPPPLLAAPSVESVDSVTKVAGDVAKPQGPPEVSDEEKMRLALEFARKEAGRDEGRSMMLRAGANMAGAISGQKVDQGFYDRLDEGARRPMADLEKDHAGQRQRNKEKLELDLKKSAAELDREAKVKDWIYKELGLTNAEAARKADDKRADAQLAEANRHNLATEGTAALDSERRARKYKNTGGYGKKNKPGDGIDDPEGSGELDAPGWRRGPNAPTIKKEAAADFRESTASHMQISASAADLRGLIKESGSEMYGDTAAKMAAISRDLLLEMKNLAKLGVLSKSDEGIINDLIPNPTGMAGAMRSTSSMLTQLDQFQALIDRKLAAKAFSLGYDKDEPEGEDGPRRAPVGGQHDLSGAAPGPGWTRGSVKGRPGWISPDKSEFEAD